MKNKRKLENPNFSIIMPGGCNASCNYCFWKEEKNVHPDYINMLSNSLDVLGGKVTQVSLTGGEPTLSPHFDSIIEVLRGRNKKVVLSTNGTRLASKIPVISGVVNHVNISRNSYDYLDNASLFGTRDTPEGAFSIRQLSLACNKECVNITISKVVTDKELFGLAELSGFVHLAKSSNASGLIIRKCNNDSLAPLPVEAELNCNHQVSKCDVCAEHFYWINGLPVFFKMALKDPSKTIPDFEWIFHPSGRLSHSWKDVE